MVGGGVNGTESLGQSATQCPRVRVREPRHVSLHCLQFPIDLQSILGEREEHGDSDVELAGLDGRYSSLGISGRPIDNLSVP